MPRIINKIGDGYSFPLGLPYISSSLKNAKFQIFTYNLNHHEGKIEDLLKTQIETNKIDVVLTGGLSFQYYPLKQLVSAVKKINPIITVVVGGGVITGDPQPAMLALEDVDIGCIGEGEVTAVNICRALEEHLPLEDVKGLIIKKSDNSFLITSPQSEITNIDEITWPDYDGFELEKSFDNTPGVSGLNSTRTLFMLGSRSCPYQCSFCFHTVGKKYRQRTLDNFFKELEYNMNKYKIDYLCIADELFSYNNERVLEFCERIKKFNIGWWAQFRVDSFDGEILTKIKESGCKTMSFGLESADNAVLKSMGKRTTIEQIDKTLKQVYDAKISFEGAFIFGDEAESYETATNTLNYFLKYPEYKINLNTITVFPGCRLYKNAVKNEIIKNPVKYLQDGCPQLNNTKMTKIEYVDIIKKIVEYPFSKTKLMKFMKLLHIYKNEARIDILGKCEVCGSESEYSKIKLFATNFLGCQHCGQRYNVLIPQEILENIGHQVEHLTTTYDNIAVWGINYHTFRLFDKIQQLNTNAVYPVDISEIKQELILNTRKVNSPAIINEKAISTVVIAIPAYYNQIELQIQYQYPQVKTIIDICDLVDETLYKKMG
jgi:radical SAM superfamily enzyme YgiQ (UPF0313 family)